MTSNDALTRAANALGEGRQISFRRYMDAYSKWRLSGGREPVVDGMAGDDFYDALARASSRELGGQ